MRRAGVAAALATVLALAVQSGDAAECLGDKFPLNDACQTRPECCEDGLKCFELSGPSFRCLAQCPANDASCAELTCDQPEIDPGPVDATGIANKLGRLSVKNNQLVDKDGKAVQLVGVNVDLISNENCFQFSSLRLAVTDWGVSLFRMSLRVKVDNGEQPLGGITEDPATWAPLRNVVDNCVRLGVYCILNFDTRTPEVQAVVDVAQEFWADFATRFGNNDNIIFDIAGTPSGVVDNWSDIKEIFHVPIIKTIRAIAPTTVITMGLPQSNQVTASAVADPITAEDLGAGSNGVPANAAQNLMYDFFFAGGSKTVNQVTSLIDDNFPYIVAGWSANDDLRTNGPFIVQSRPTVDLFANKEDILFSTISWTMQGFNQFFTTESMLIAGSCSSTTTELVATCYGEFARTMIRRSSKDFLDSINFGEDDNEDGGDGNIAVIAGAAAGGVVLLAVVVFVVLRRRRAAAQNDAWSGSFGGSFGGKNSQFNSFGSGSATMASSPPASTKLDFVMVNSGTSPRPPPGLDAHQSASSMIVARDDRFPSLAPNYARESTFGTVRRPSV